MLLKIIMDMMLPMPYVTLVSNFIIQIISTPLFIVLTPASQIMLSHSKEFSRVILNDDLVTLLLTETVITRDMQETIKKRRYSLDGLPFRTICRTVANEQEKLKLLADALKRHVETFPLGTKLLEDYCKSLIDYNN